MTSPSLETRDLTIRFGGHVAVNAVSSRFGLPRGVTRSTPAGRRNRCNY